MCYSVFCCCRFKMQFIFSVTCIFQIIFSSPTLRMLLEQRDALQKPFVYSLRVYHVQRLCISAFNSNAQHCTNTISWQALALKLRRKIPINRCEYLNIKSFFLLPLCVNAFASPWICSDGAPHETRLLNLDHFKAIFILRRIFSPLISKSSPKWVSFFYECCALNPKIQILLCSFDSSIIYLSINSYLFFPFRDWGGQLK